MFNYDESGLNYKMLPSKTLAARTKAAVTGNAINMAKKGLRIFAWNNATEICKINLTMTGKYKSL